MEIMQIRNWMKKRCVSRALRVNPKHLQELGSCLEKGEMLHRSQYLVV
jgi:hypothetical protein